MRAPCHIGPMTRTSHTPLADALMSLVFRRDVEEHFHHKVTHHNVKSDNTIEGPLPLQYLLAKEFMRDISMEH